MVANMRIITLIRLTTIRAVQFSSKPTSSEVLTAYLMQCNEPPWTSYFVKVISLFTPVAYMLTFHMYLAIYIPTQTK